MTFLLSAWLILAMGDFPEANDPELVQDVAESDDPIVSPDEPVPENSWKTQTVRPKDISPRKSSGAQVSQPQALPQAPILGTTTRSATPSAPQQAAPAKPVKHNGPVIGGYHVGAWNDTKFSIQKQFPEDKPLLERGNGKWMIQDTCESEKASVTFRFSTEDRMNQVVCQFRQGVENTNPDYPLYQKVRRLLTQRWGDPASTNESPAPDSPSQASEWAGHASRAVLIFDLESSSLQLTVESLQ